MIFDVVLWIEGCRSLVARGFMSCLVDFFSLTTELKYQINPKAKLHESYVKNIMNPFTSLTEKIQEPCTEFDKGVAEAIERYNAAVGETASS